VAGIQPNNKQLEEREGSTRCNKMPTRCQFIHNHDAIYGRFPVILDFIDRSRLGNNILAVHEPSSLRSCQRYIGIPFLSVCIYGMKKRCNMVWVNPNVRSLQIAAMGSVRSTVEP
jgi:hypothetical protein